jgi:hypothetical protein
VVATVSAYSVEPGTWVTDAVWMATTASCLSPRCPSPKLVNAVAAVYATGNNWKTIRNRVPGIRYFAGMCRGPAYR